MEKATGVIACQLPRVWASKREEAMNRSNDAFDFAIRIAELVRYLREKPERFPLCPELLNAGVRAGMAVRDIDDLDGEAEQARSREAVKAIDEASYYLDMAVHSGYLTELEASHVVRDAAELRAEFSRDLPSGIPHEGAAP